MQNLYNKQSINSKIRIRLRQQIGRRYRHRLFTPQTSQASMTSVCLPSRSQVLHRRPSIAGEQSNRNTRCLQSCLKSFCVASSSRNCLLRCHFCSQAIPINIHIANNRAFMEYAPEDLIDYQKRRCGNPPWETEKCRNRSGLTSDYQNLKHISSAISNRIAKITVDGERARGRTWNLLIIQQIVVKRLAIGPRIPNSMGITTCLSCDSWM